MYIPILDTVDPKTLGKDAKTLLQEFLQGKKIALPQYNVVATHGAAHNQEFEVECLVPKFVRDEAYELLAEVLILSLMFGFKEW